MDVKTFSLEDLQIATDNWDPKHILGRGGFATVFLATIPGEGRVAVKNSSPIANLDERERKFALGSMRAEIDTMSRYRH